MEKQQRIKELEQQIIHHRNLYYNHIPEISDEEYDKLEEELKSLDPQNELFSKVGANPTYGQKIKHFIPMGSLSKITYDKDENGEFLSTFSELEDWIKKYIQFDKIYVSYKIDGLSCEITYNEKGDLVKAVTRGDGYNGVDVLHIVKHIKSIPNKITNYYNNFINLRGEIYLSKSYFNTYIKPSLKENEIKNCRNLASGALKREQPSEISKYGLHFKIFNMYFNYKELDTEDIKKTVCKNLGFINNYVGLYEVTLSNLENLINELYLNKNNLDYDVDGLVFTLNTTRIRESFGYTSLIPKARIAFKFIPNSVISTIKDIEWQVGRTGKLTPVAIIQPVELDGTLVQKCSIHNPDEIKRLNITKNCDVIIHKCGEIIPQIKQAINNKDKESFDIPIKCPSCGYDLIKDGPNIFCNNVNCNIKKVEKTLYYLQTIGVKNIGPSIIAQLYDEKLIEDIDDLYKLKKEDLEKLDNFGDKSAKNFIKDLHKIKDIPLYLFIASLGIKGLGNTMSEKICEQYDTLEKLLNITKNELLEIEGISEITANNILEGLQYQKPLMDKLLKYITIKKEINEIKENKLLGKSFCITGKLSKPRKQIEKLIKEFGGVISSNKKGLDYLIIGDGAKEHKISKAKKNGAEIINENVLKQWLD